MLLIELEGQFTFPDNQANMGNSKVGSGGGQHCRLPITLLKRTLFSWLWRRRVTVIHPLTIEPALHLRGSCADQMSLVDTVYQHGLGWLEPSLHQHLLALTAHHGSAYQTHQENQADDAARGRSAKSIYVTLLISHLWIADGPCGPSLAVSTWKPNIISPGSRRA